MTTSTIHDQNGHAHENVRMVEDEPWLCPQCESGIIDVIVPSGKWRCGSCSYTFHRTADEYEAALAAPAETGVDIHALIDNLQAQITELTGQVTTLTGRVSKLETEVGKLRE